MNGVLAEILAAKRDEVTLLHQPQARDAIRRAALDAPATRDFAAALRRSDGRVAVIAEIKRRSPSKGELAPDLDPAVMAKAYEAGGAAALSVLTDRPFFGGSVDDLRSARDATGIPVLRKDFTIDETQVLEARAIGADALLLIAAAVPDDALLAELHGFAGDLGLGALVEVHDEAELDRAVGIGAGVVGVNCRDLATFGEDLGVAERLAQRLPRDVIAVAESAIRSPGDARRMADAGFDAVLVGEALVRSPDPTILVQELAAVSATPGHGRERGTGRG
ncbi:MAG TPA: indole-3-glycerol phosphate synthase TrpC [Acidimicrobiia bacterium]